MGQGVQLNLKMRDQRFSLRYRKTCNPWGQDYVLRGLDSEIFLTPRVEGILSTSAVAVGAIRDRRH